MVANRTRLLLMVVGLMVALVGAVTIGDRVWGQAEDRLITLELRDASLEDALRLIFKDTPYSFTLESGVIGTVTLTLNDVTFSQALRAILQMHSLTYRKDENIYHIVRELPDIAPAPPPEEYQPAPRQNIYWFGPGGRYELQYLDCRLVAQWFGGYQITTGLVPWAVEAGGGVGGGVGGGMTGGGLGGTTGGGLGGTTGGGLGGTTGGSLGGGSLGGTTGGSLGGGSFGGTTGGGGGGGGRGGGGRGGR